MQREIGEALVSGVKPALAPEALYSGALDLFLQPAVVPFYFLLLFAFGIKILSGCSLETVDAIRQYFGIRNSKK